MDTREIKSLIKTALDLNGLGSDDVTVNVHDSYAEITDMLNRTLTVYFPSERYGGPWDAYVSFPSFGGITPIDAVAFARMIEAGAFVASFMNKTNRS